jgi:zinc/manganese transport system permease protein
MNTELVDLTIIGPAFLAGLLVLSTHIPLGQEVLNRGIIFIDLAVAQVAGLGVIVAATFDWNFYGVAAQVSAVSAALMATLLLHWIEKKFPDVQEAMIGVMFVLAATASILVLAENPHGGEHLKDLLVGQILWVTLDMLWPIAIAYTIVLAIWFGSEGKIGRFTFYLIFAVTITASVQLVGVYLVFASLIIPAIASRKLSGKARLLTSYALGAGAYGSGLLLSAIFDFPPGAIIVWCLFIFGLAASLMIFWASTNRATRVPG